MLEIIEDSRFKVQDTVSVRNVLGETFFILDSATGKQYDLTEMEYEIVTSIAQGATFADVVNKIASEYDATFLQVKQDLREYIVSLFEAGLIAKDDEACQSKDS